MHISRGLPLISAEHEPHLPALQFQRTARSGACVGLDPVDDVEDDHALVDLDAVVLAARRPSSSPRQIRNVARRSPSVSPPSASARQLVVGQVLLELARARTARSSSGRHRRAAAARDHDASSPSARQIRVDLAPLVGLMPGKSSRVWPPRLSARSSAARGDASETDAACCAGRAPGASRG